MSGRSRVTFDDTTVYGGLVTRTIAFVIDALLVNGLLIGLTNVLGVTMAVITGNRPDDSTAVDLLTGAAVFAIWSLLYFVTCWSINGRTLGNAVMGIRVVRARDGRPPGVGRALARFIVLSLGVLPMLAGLLMVLWSPRRRGLHDRLTGTVVVQDLRGVFSPTAAIRREE